MVALDCPAVAAPDSGEKGDAEAENFRSMRA
jgi:hypothetical protein